MVVSRSFRGNWDELMKQYIIAEAKKAKINVAFASDPCESRLQARNVIIADGLIPFYLNGF